VYFTQSFPALVASLIEQEAITFSEDSFVRLVNRELHFLGKSSFPGINLAHRNDGYNSLTKGGSPLTAS
jgi:hypothetical protein